MISKTPSQEDARNLTTAIVLFVLGLLVCLGYFVYVRTVQHRVEVKRDAFHALGLPATAVELDEWHGEPPDGPNAADIYRDAAHVFHAPDDSYEIFHMDLDKLDDAETNIWICSFLQANEATLLLLADAAAITNYHQDLDFTRGFQIRIPHCYDILGFARMLRLRSAIAASSGHIAESVDAIGQMYKMAQELQSEPLLTSQLVAIAIEANAIDVMEWVMGRIDIDPPYLEQLAAILSDVDATDTIWRGYIGEVCTMQVAFDDPVAGFRSGCGCASMGPSVGMSIAFGVYHIAGLRDLDNAYFLDAMHRYYLAAVAPPSTQLAQARHVRSYVQSTGAPYLMSRMLLPALTESFSANLQQTAETRLALTAVGIELFRAQYGNIPMCADGLSPEFLPSVPVDPFDGNLLRYHATDSGYALWSVGPDRTDDGGATPVAGRPQTGEDITFVVQR